MKGYLYDYNRTYFLDKIDDNKKEYYFKIDNFFVIHRDIDDIRILPFVVFERNIRLFTYPKDNRF